MKNITYFLGAGASYHSCPIQKEQANEMIHLARKYLPKEMTDFNKKPQNLTIQGNILWDIGYFGNKAIKYGSTDTYAKKLIFSGSSAELERMKLAISVFFTLWQFTDDYELKDSKRYEDNEIDRRFIQLMASVLNKTNNHFPSLQDNIHFVTWNYDLQIESAYKAFCPETALWKDVVQKLKFQTSSNMNEDNQICHLNGYHGFYSIHGDEKNILDLIIGLKDIHAILREICYIEDSQNKGNIDITGHINYAWETDAPVALNAREQAKNIFSQTDILIIIGYSFPNFNKDVDKQLFDQLKGRNTIIFYQDPNASKEFLSQLVNLNIKETSLIIEREKKDVFILPYEF